jgi:hypothetical protein
MTNLGLVIVEVRCLLEVAAGIWAGLAAGSKKDVSVGLLMREDRRKMRRGLARGGSWKRNMEI